MSLNEILTNAVIDGVISAEDAHRITATLADAELSDDELVLMDLLLEDEF